MPMCFTLARYRLVLGWRVVGFPSRIRFALMFIRARHDLACTTVSGVGRCEVRLRSGYVAGSKIARGTDRKKKYETSLETLHRFLTFGEVDWSLGGRGRPSKSRPC